MLSKPAFAALLKTLEEPPEHVKFVFATTEIRKVPVTILSRCQRFDLRRIDSGVLEKYFAELLTKEKVEADAAAIAMIARAADGSARDGLSLLDQAISREPKKITAQQVGEMLGLVDRSVTLDLFEAVMKGSSQPALALLDSLYKGGADAAMVLQDLLDLTHYLTKVKVAPELAKDMALPEAERVRGLELAQGLPIPVLTRAWQMLLKGVQEVQQAPQPQLALEMLMIRLIYVSDQPTPGDVLKQLKDGGTVSMGASPMGSPGGGSSRPTLMSRTAAAPAALGDLDAGAQARVNGFDDVVALFGQRREAILQSQLMNFAHLVKFEQGHLSLRLKEGAPHGLAGQISNKLGEWTGQRWVVSLSREAGEPTLSETKQSQQQAVMSDVKANPVVAEAMKVFPGAKIIDIRERK
jgi:DNA polymerase-3 subunit gamma/tau